MKKIRSETEDWLRPEYERADLGELVRGKDAITQVAFPELVALMIACIGEDNNIQFDHSKRNHLTRRNKGDWTYEIDNANQITLRYWLSDFKNIAEEISTPTCISTPKEREEFQKLLLDHILILKAKVS